MLADRERDDDVLAHFCLVEIGDRMALHEALRQVVDEVAHPRQPQLLQRAHELGANPFQRLGLDEQGVERFGPHGALLACLLMVPPETLKRPSAPATPGVGLPVAALCLTGAAMSDTANLSPRLARIRFRAWHRGTREADYMIGCYFDRFNQAWSDADVQWFEELIEEDDVDIMAWALMTQAVPERYAGTLMARMQQLDYVDIPR